MKIGLGYLEELKESLQKNYARKLEKLTKVQTKKWKYNGRRNEH